MVWRRRIFTHRKVEQRGEVPPRVNCFAAAGLSLVQIRPPQPRISFVSATSPNPATIRIDKTLVALSERDWPAEIIGSRQCFRTLATFRKDYLPTGPPSHKRAAKMVRAGPWGIV